MEPTGFGSLSGGPLGSQLVPPQFSHVGSAEPLASVMELSQLAQVYEPAGAELPAVRVDIAVLSREG
jgi:hypothetical protein